jgi:medium-chain acyl-[acyl-carrier-protein] hydrolase
MPPLAVWEEEVTVKTYATDFMGRWKPGFLVQELTEFASHHASNLGLDYQGMLEKDMVWVLSRLKLRFYQHPMLGQQMMVKTWPKGIQQRLFFMRDFELRTLQGQPVVAASFAWLLVNPKIRRILPPQSLGAGIPDNGGLSAIPEALDKLSPPGDLVERFKVQARYSTIDLLGHANSARYVDWICDCFSQEDYRARPLDWLQLNFINETLPGEQLSIAAGPDPAAPGTWYVTGTNLNTGLRSFDAALGWK